MTDTIDNTIRGYIHGLPGAMWGNSSKDCLTRVIVASGVVGDLEEVRRALWRYGFEPTQVGCRWAIAFPNGGPR